MAICHILPEADAMYGQYLARVEAEELAAQQKAEIEHGEDHHDDDDHEGEDDDHEGEGEHHDGEEEGHDDHDDHAGHDEHADHADEGHGFPLAYTFFVVGFLIMLTMDKVLFASAEIKVEEAEEPKPGSQEKTQEMVVKSASHETDKDGVEQTENKVNPASHDGGEIQ